MASNAMNAMYDVVHSIETYIQEVDARRKKKHRELMRSRRQKERQTLAKLQEQEFVLRKKLKDVLRYFNDHPQDASNELEFRRKYVQAVQLAEAVRKENEKLMKLLDDHDDFARVMQLGLQKMTALFETSVDGTTEYSVLDRAETEHGFWTQLRPDDPHDAEFYYIKMHQLEVEAHVRKLYETFCTFESEFELHLPFMDGVNMDCFGWKVTYGRRVHHEDPTRNGIVYRFTKIINANGLMIEDVASRTWLMFNTPELYASMYRTVMVSQVLQAVNDHSSVIIRSWEIGNRAVEGRFISVCSRTEDMNGYQCSVTGQRGRRLLVMMRIVEPDDRIINLEKSKDAITTSANAIEAPQLSAAEPRKSIQWIRNGFLCLTFSYSDASCTKFKVQYNAHVNTNIEAEQAQHAVLESGEALLRWEQRFIAPTPLLSSQSHTP